MPDEMSTTIESEPEAPAQAGDLSMVAVSEVDAEALRANLSAIASANTGSLETMGSAVGLANVTQDAHVNLSWAGVVATKGNATVRQSYTSAVLASNSMSVSQAGAAAVIGREVSFDQGGAGVVVASEAAIKRGFVGVVLSGRTSVSEDSKVLISTQAALIIAAAIFGIFGIAILMGFLAVRRARRWASDLSLPHMPNMDQLREGFDKFQHAREQFMKMQAWKHAA